MTQQYIIGELSSLVGQLQRSSPGVLDGGLRDLRERVEHASVSTLPPLASEAITAADRLCWRSIERGDLTAFCEQATVAAALNELAVCAGLLP